MSGSDFWSRRRAAVDAESRADDAATLAQQQVRAERDLSERSDHEILDDLDLPEPEQLESAEAVREFLTSAVPQRLKNRALRRLWRLNPVLANLDGLLDYGEDYTDSATVIDNIQTAYQVGKGMMAHVEELARQAAPEDDGADMTDMTPDEPMPPQDGEGAEPLALTEEGQIDMPVAPVNPDPQASTQDPDISDDETAGLPANRRRMQFRFESTT